MADSQQDQPTAERPKRVKKKYVPAVTPRLKIALVAIFVLFALLAANSVYLGGITAMEYFTGNYLQDFFYQWMFLLHLVLGFLLLVPFILFVYFHLIATMRRKNRSAVRVGYVLLVICIVLLGSGVLLTRIPGSLELKQPQVRQLVYWAHVICPVLVVWMYVIHRLAGPPIKWSVGLSYAGVVGVVVAGLIFLKLQDPRDFAAVGSPESATYFEPSLVRTRGGNFLPEHALMSDEYCMECHQDIYDDHNHSVHKFSSFNNPAYLVSVAEVRDTVEKRDGSVQASRWCAGCHDPVPFLSGKFDDPNFDMHGGDPTAHAGVTCVVCHAITSIGDESGTVIGNADYSIEEPIHYPFAYSENSVLKWINHQMVKAKPEFHKQMMLKPVHKDPDFCTTCHKVSLPFELNNYKEWMRGQNHFDNYHLSGVSGHGIRSFYYPPAAQDNCNECHMPRKESDDFAAILNQVTGKMEIHDHLFPSANTALAWWRGDEETIQAHTKFLDKVMRVDIFGVKEEGRIDGELHAPIRPELPVLEPGKTYLIENVIRTMKMGHPFTQGTVDSNEVWMEMTAIENAEFDDDGKLVGGRILGKTGGLDPKGEVDPWSHFLNVFMLDKDGNRIDRRNAHHIFTPLYNHQMPPGAGQIVHYKLRVPEDVTGPVTVVSRLNYRKFDWQYLKYIHNYHLEHNLELRGLDPSGIVVNELPIVLLAEDKVTFPVTEAQIAEVKVEGAEESLPAEWIRWNDYGIGLMITAGGAGKMLRGELRQAEEAFSHTEQLGRYDGPLNLARIYLSEGSLDLATEALQRANEMKDDEGLAESFPHWTHRWLTGMVNRQQGNLKEAVKNFEQALNYTSPATDKRGFDFTQDWVVRNQYAETVFDLAKQYPAGDEEREKLMNFAVEQYQKVLELDSENGDAHYGLQQVYGLLGQTEDAHRHRELHQKYKTDDNAREALNKARKKYPAANHAAEAVVIYDLHRPSPFKTSLEEFELGVGATLEDNFSAAKNDFEGNPPKETEPVDGQANGNDPNRSPAVASQPSTRQPSTP